MWIIISIYHSNHWGLMCLSWADVLSHPSCFWLVRAIFSVTISHLLQFWEICDITILSISRKVNTVWFTHRSHGCKVKNKMTATMDLHILGKRYISEMIFRVRLYTVPNAQWGVGTVPTLWGMHNSVSQRSSGTSKGNLVHKFYETV